VSFGMFLSHYNLRTWMHFVVYGTVFGLGNFLVHHILDCRKNIN